MINKIVEGFSESDSLDTERFIKDILKRKYNVKEVKIFWNENNYKKRVKGGLKIKGYNYKAQLIK